MDFCYNCRKYTQYSLQKAKINKVIDGKNYTFNITIAVCNECGNEVTPLGLINYNIKEFEQQYREKKHG